MTQKLTAAALEAMSVSDLLDLPWDAIEAAQGFTLPPEGSYYVTVLEAKVGAVGKKGEEKESISLEFQIDDTLELLTETDAKPEAGTKFDINYISGKGGSYFKRDFTEVAQALGIASLRDFLTALKGAKLALILTHRAGNNGAKYPQISIVTLAN